MRALEQLLRGVRDALANTGDADTQTKISPQLAAVDDGLNRMEATIAAGGNGLEENPATLTSVLSSLADGLSGAGANAAQVRAVRTRVELQRLIAAVNPTVGYGGADTIPEVFDSVLDPFVALALALAYLTMSVLYAADVFVKSGRVAFEHHWIEKIVWFLGETLPNGLSMFVLNDNNQHGHSLYMGGAALAGTGSRSWTGRGRPGPLRAPGRPGPPRCWHFVASARC